MIRQCNENKCECHCRVLVVDNDQTDRDDHVYDLRRWGFEPIAAEGEGDELLVDAKRKVRQYACHAAVVDMRLYDDQDPQDYSGIDLVKDLQPAFCIVVTGHDDVPRSRAANNHGAVMIGKGEGPAPLHSELCKTLNRFCYQGLRITPSSWIPEQIALKLGEHDGLQETEIEIRDILAMSFPTARELVLGELSGNTRPLDADMSPSTYDRSIRRRSVVITVAPDRMQPLLAKFTSRDRSRREAENYRTYVDGRLGGNFHPRLQFSHQLWNLGVSVYQLITATKSSGLYREYFDNNADPKRLIHPLRMFFTEVWHPLYKERHRLNTSLLDAYNTLWRSTRQDGEVPFNTSLLNEWSTFREKRKFEGLAGTYPEPRSWLHGEHERSFFAEAYTSTVHGDFHADNIIVDDSANTWVIDFERTGPGHILSDVAEIEHDLLTRILPFSIQSNRVFYELVVSLVAAIDSDTPLILTRLIAENYEANKVFQVVKELRGIIREVFQLHDNQEYYWALLLRSLYVSLKLPEDQERRRTRCLILASVICGRLDNWHLNQWPPQEWDQVEWGVA